MKSLLVYYSKTGKTEKAALAIAEKLNAEIEKIIDLKSRKGFFGFVLGGRDALKKNLTEISPPKKAPEKYDLVIIGTPVWAGTMVPAVRAYLANSKGIKKAAFFCTSSSGKAQRAFADMHELIVDAKVIAELGLTGDDIRKGAAEKIGEFVAAIKK